MKYLVLLTILAVGTCKGQTIKLGDNLKTEFRKIPKPYFSAAPDFTDWAEGANMLLIGNKPNPNDCDFVFIALKDTTLVGVLTTKDSIIIMFDGEGNSILSEASPYFLLPLWTVKNKTKIDSTDKSILKLFDKMYEKTLQADELELDNLTIQEYQRYRIDTTLANRHIALLFDNYQNIISETSGKGEPAPAAICVPLMKLISKECVSLYHKVPVVVCIYMGEALASAGMMDDARDQFKKSLQIYPNSIPLQVYNYRFEQEPEKKKELLSDLKKKYPKHWMVKDL